MIEIDRHSTYTLVWILFYSPYYLVEKGYKKSQMLYNFDSSYCDLRALLGGIDQIINLEMKQRLLLYLDCILAVFVTEIF